jgi:aflatoxin B1 aldehyde reductase
MDKFLSKGYNEVDTALMYTGGKSEQVLGRYLQQTSNKVVVATKANPWENKTLSSASVSEQMGCSLTSLQSSSVDIFYLHAPDHNTPLEETLRGVNTLHQEGKFKELALSNYSAWEVADAWHICKSNGWVLPTVYQGMYNAITRKVEPELFPCLRQFGLRFYAYNPLAGGILSGRYKYTDKEQAPEGRFFGDNWAKAYVDRYWRPSVFDGVQMVQTALEKSYGADQVGLVSAAFRWLNHHSLMAPEHGDTILIGCSRLEYLDSNLAACDEGPLDPGVVEAFNEAWQLDKGNSADYFR